MSLSIIIISDITIVVVADFLLAASLTVRHGLPGHRSLWAPAPPLAATAAVAAAWRGKKGWRAGGGGSPAGKGRSEGGEEGRREGSVPPGQGAERAERGVAAAPTRDTGEGEGTAEPPLEAEGRRDASTVASTGEDGIWLEKEAASGLGQKFF